MVSVQLEPRFEPGPEGLPGFEPDRTTTDWGRSERLTALADATVLHFLYHYWFRVEAEGLDNVPAAGGALLLANRAGRLPLDGAMIVRSVREEHPLGRSVQLAATRCYEELPGLGMVLTKLGAVAAHPANLHRLLFDERELVLAFPEVAAGARKSLRSRYRLHGFDARQLVEAATAAGAPIVPVAVLGAEEALPALGSLSLPGGRLRIPLAALAPLSARLRIRFLEPLATSGQDAAPPRGRSATADLADAVRALIQENLLEMVAQRSSVWLG